MSMYFASLSLLATSASPPVDTVRQSLIDRSDRWFFWLVVSSIVVGIGVCLEAPESTIALKRWFRHWRREPDVPPEDERSLAIPASYLGLLLVILGVAGEGIFEALSSNAETTLRAHDEQVLGDTISKAGDAADAATRANTAATGAETKAKAAGEKSAQAENSAATALVTARNARREADSFEAKIASAETKAADAESHLAESLERANSAEKESIRLRDILGGWQLDEDAMKLFAIDTQGFLGTPFDLAVNPNEASFMEELDGILTSPSVGWVRLPPKDTSGTGVTMLIDGKASVLLTSGIMLEVDQDQVDPLKPAITALGTALREELHLDTINLHLVPPGSWGKRIHIIIGKRQ